MNMYVKNYVSGLIYKFGQHLKKKLPLVPSYDLKGKININHYARLSNMKMYVKNKYIG